MDPKFQVIYFALKQNGIFHKPRGRFFRTKRLRAAAFILFGGGFVWKTELPRAAASFLFLGMELRQISGGTISTISTISTMRTISTIS